MLFCHLSHIFFSPGLKWGRGKLKINFKLSPIDCIHNYCSNHTTPELLDWEGYFREQMGDLGMLSFVDPGDRHFIFSYWEVLIWEILPPPEKHNTRYIGSAEYSHSG